jgi:hypothetical protein
MSSSLDLKPVRVIDLGIYENLALKTLFKLIRSSDYTERSLQKVYNQYFSLLRVHEDKYIKDEPSQLLQKRYYSEIMAAIQLLINTIINTFTRQMEQYGPLFKSTIITPLRGLISFYNEKRKNIEIPTAIATDINPVATAEIVPAETTSAPTVEPRFATNTNVAEGGGFVSRIRNFISRGFSNENNNPITEAQAVVVNPTPRPPAEAQVSTSFRSGRNIAPRFQIVAGGSAAALEETEEPEEPIRLTGGGRMGNI